MATTKTISAALKLIDSKKENLRKAFEELHSHSSSLSSFSLSWSDLDSYFTALQSSLELQFLKLIQSDDPQTQSQPSKPSTNQPPPSSSQPPSKPSTNQQPPSSSQPPSKPSPEQLPSSTSAIAKNSSENAYVPARPELKSLCENMDGLGLRNYIVQRLEESKEIRVELPDALSHAADAPAMVLDAVEGLYSKQMELRELRAIRRTCLALLEGLMRVSSEIKPEVRERAKNLAMEWKKKATVDGDSALPALGFLHLVVSYQLVDWFNSVELTDFAVRIAGLRQGIELIRMLCLGDKIPDLIQKFISEGNQLLAVKFVFEFELTDKFPPVPLLKDYVRESKKLARQVRKDSKNSLQSLKGAAMKETKSLREVIKYIDEHKLESEYPKENLVKRIKTLEKVQEKVQAGKKRIAPAPFAKPHPNQRGNKRVRTTAPTGPAPFRKSVATASPAVPPIQQPHHLPPTGPYGLGVSAPAVASYGSAPAVAPYRSALTIPQHGSAPAVPQYGSAPAVAQYGSAPTVPPYSSAPTVSPYGSASAIPQYGSAPAVPQYGSSPAVPAYASGSAVPPYGVPELQGFSGNQNPTGFHQYPSESHMPTSHFDTPVAYSGYGLPQPYHSAYYPQ